MIYLNWFDTVNKFEIFTNCVKHVSCVQFSNIQLFLLHGRVNKKLKGERSILTSQNATGISES